MGVELWSVSLMKNRVLQDTLSRRVEPEKSSIAFCYCFFYTGVASRDRNVSSVSFNEGNFVQNVAVDICSEIIPVA